MNSATHYMQSAQKHETTYLYALVKMGQKVSKIGVELEGFFVANTLAMASWASFAKAN